MIKLLNSSLNLIDFFCLLCLSFCVHHFRVSTVIDEISYSTEVFENFTKCLLHFTFY